MTRINTNTASINAYRNLSNSNKLLSKTLQQLSSGSQINQASDNPSGLVISEFLSRDIAGLNQAVSNTSRASNLLSTAEGGLGQVSSLLITMRSLTVEAANTGAMSSEEIDANQQQVDSALSSIDRIAATTSFGTQNLLNGSLDFRITRGGAAAGTAGWDMEKVQVNQALTDLTNGNTTTKNLDVTTDAYVAGGAGAARATAGNAAGTIFSAALAAGQSSSVRITGPKGSQIFSFSGVTTVAQMASAVSAKADKLGLQADAAGNFASQEYGSDQKITVEQVSGTAIVNAGTRSGQDITGTIAGRAATGHGRTLSINDGDYDVSVTFKAAEDRLGAAFTVAAHTSLNAAAVTYTGAANGVQYTNRTGAKFQLGKDGTASNQVTLGIHSVDSSTLGLAAIAGTSTNLSMLRSGGTYNLSTNPERATQIIDQAIKDVATMDGRLGALQKNTFETALNSMNVSVENLSSSQSAIKDTDFASAAAQLTKAQILVSAGTSVLATANVTPQNVLALLGQ